MLGILCLLSCLGAVFCGGIGVADPLLQYSIAAGAPARSSIAYGNAAFLARYGLATPYAGAALATPYAGAALATPYAGAALAAPVGVAAPLAATTTYHEGALAAPFGAHLYQGAVAAPLLASRTAIAAPLAAHTAVAAPVAHAAIAAPVAHAAVAAPVATAHVATPLVATATAIPAVEHVPAVAQVPVTKYEAQHALVQNVVDVANPKIATRKFEIRRPAIQKQFYDIEERVVVRPAGSAVVELDQPISKKQRGPAVVSPAVQPVLAAAPVRALPVAHSIHAHHSFLPALSAYPVHSYPFQSIPAQQFEISSVGAAPEQPAQPAPPRPELPSQPPQSDDSDSVAVENPEFSGARMSQQQRPDADLSTLFRGQTDFRNQQQLQARAEAEFRAQQDFQTRARQQAQQQLIEQQQLMEQEMQARFRSQQQTEQRRPPAPVKENVEIRSRISEVRNEQERTSQSIQEIPSVRNLPDIELSNQARLIALLTERGPVSEVRSGDSLDGRVRARVLSVTPAPLNSDAQDEKVNTRRVVVSRPIQTVQEVDVVEPFTKIDRVTVNQPAIIKTARLGVANVATSVPVQHYIHAHHLY